MLKLLSGSDSFALDGLMLITIATSTFAMPSSDILMSIWVTPLDWSSPRSLIDVTLH